MISSHRPDAQLYRITYPGNVGDADARTVEAGEVAGIVEEAGQYGRQVLVRPYAHPQDALDTGERRGLVIDGKPEESAAAKHERWLAKGVALRAFFYIAGTHLFAGFVWLLFFLGQHAQK
ncbi:hypothetical protein DRB96_01835 [Streptomyces sp. ICC1]|nr:hypothetical protein DRB89_01045 [Streptomyces sp. ICC4]AWZ11278.1 hypothetical protein DRB96_01835 [Streptomyces sp. ICC1]